MKTVTVMYAGPNDTEEIANSTGVEVTPGGALRIKKLGKTIYIAPGKWFACREEDA